jgi:hypothetical protein
LKYISVDKGVLYGVDKNDDIFFMDCKCLNWNKINGKLKQVQSNGNVVCGVSSIDQIFCKDDLYSSNWRQLTGGLKYVTVLEGGRLFGVSSNDQIWYNNDYKEKSNWMLIPGGLKQIDSDGTMTCGVNSGNNLFCRKDLFSDWVLQ